MQSMVSMLDLARRIPVLSHLSEQQGLDLSPHWQKCQFEKGQVMARQGFVPSQVFFLLAGRARVLRMDRSGREFILYKVQIGDPVEAASVIDGEPNSATVVAETRTDVLALDKRVFMHCVYHNGALAHAFMRHMAHRVRQQEGRIATLVLLDVKGRVCRALIDQAVPTDDAHWLVPDPLQRRDLAKMVGASREMVSRVLKDLEAGGYLTVDACRRIKLEPKLLEESSPH